MDQYGKKQEVLIFKDILGRVTIWADAGLSSELQKIPGVAYVYVSSYKPNEYSVEIDPRYDTKTVENNLAKLINGKVGCCPHGHKDWDDCPDCCH